MDFNQDFAVGGFDALMQPLYRDKGCPRGSAPIARSSVLPTREARHGHHQSGTPSSTAVWADLLSGSLTLQGSGPLTRHTS